MEAWLGRALGSGVAGGLPPCKMPGHAAGQRLRVLDECTEGVVAVYQRCFVDRLWYAARQGAKGLEFFGVVLAVGDEDEASGARPSTWLST